MSLGILGNATPALRRLRSMRGTPPLRTLRTMRGYGALGATVPANCWDKPGFTDCNAQAWKVAEDRCIRQGLANQSYGGDWVKCKEVQAADYAYYGCALRICPPPVKAAPKTVGGWTWGATPTPNPSITEFQNHINICLQRNGFKLISVDGRIGPATCGAFKTIAGLCPENFSTDPVANMAVCQSWVNPTKNGETQPVKDPHSAEAQKLDEQFGGLPWMVRDARVPNLQAGLNQQLTGHEFFPIPTSGMLDATMCGGMRWLDQNTGSRWMPSWGQKCQAFTDPRRKAQPGPSGPVGPVAPTGPTGPTGPIGPSPVAPAAGTSNAMMIAGGLFAAVVIGGYAYYKSKTGGA